MTTTTISRLIDAPPDLVFETVSNIDKFATAIPHIVKVDFLTEQRSGVGTRFRETRRMKGREAATELEVAEYDPPERVRIISDTSGTIWDTLFTVSQHGDRSLLTKTMEARPHSLLARLTTPLLKGMIKKEIEKDMDLVKAYCEDTAE